jgi:hypothetical protein
VNTINLFMLDLDAYAARRSCVKNAFRVLLCNRPVTCVPVLQVLIAKNSKGVATLGAQQMAGAL